MAIEEPASNLADELGKHWDDAEASDTTTASPAAEAATLLPLPEKTEGATGTSEPAADLGSTGTAAAVVDAQAGATGGTGATGAAKDEDRPPSSLNAEVKSKWASYPAEVREEFIRRENDMHKGLTEYKTKAQNFDAIDNVLRPYIPVLAANGGNVLANVGTVMQTAYELSQNPVGTIAKLMQAYGVDPSQFAQGQQQQIDPEILALRQEVAGFRQHIQGQGQQQTQAQINEANGLIQRFASDPKNIYFENVKADVAALLSGGRASNLQDAYDKACWANPEVRAALFAQQQRDAEVKRIEESKLKAANARKAGFDVSGTGSAGQGASNMTLRDELASLLG